ncbi:GTPase Era [Aquipuribacter hungaricus]|uniref:GTPase Era n=1 Tax=Aquipuribacter hungaricus TaxID=545624 RepID=A0ABV7WDI3_9MICO
MSGTASPYRSGFACLIGRPNVGKSTLMNALVGEKVAITSDKPQTTRRSIRGVVRRQAADGGSAELVMVDTPGVHRPRTLLGERLNDLVRDSIAEVDVVTLCLPSDGPVGPGDRRLAEQVVEQVGSRRRTSVVVAVTRTDLGRGADVPERLVQAQRLADQVGLDVAHFVPTSGTRGDGVDVLADVLVSLLPEGPPLFPLEQVHDVPVDVLIAELVREAALDGVRDELPHSLAVVTEEVVPREDRPETRPLTDVRVLVYVERDSQKAIVIGKGGERLKHVGTRARRGIEGALGVPVHLDLRVKVAKDWQRDPKQLRRLGF